MRKDKLLYLFLAFTFVGLLVDIRFEHRDVLGEVWESNIPLVTSMVGVVTAFLAMSKKAALRLVAGALFFLITLVGVLGVWEHTRFRPIMFTRYLNLAETDANGQRIRGGQRPSFAPMSYTLLGSIGIVLVSRRFRWPEEESSDKR